MAKPEIELKFNLGKHVLCVEDGHGYGSGAPGMFDGVNVSIRERTTKGQPGAIVDRQFNVNRSEVLALALGFLDVASNMAAETAWNRSEAVGAIGQQRHLYPLTKVEQEALRDLSNDDAKSLRRRCGENYKNLKSRVHILQRCQRTLEVIDDNAANQLDLMLTILEQSGMLPVRIEASFSPSFDVTPASDTAH